MSRASDGAPPGPVTGHRAAPDGPGRRPGTAYPRQDGAADLRLVPPALAAWATAALTLDAPPGWTAAITVACLLAGLVLLRLAPVRPRPATASGNTRSSTASW